MANNPNAAPAAAMRFLDLPEDVLVKVLGRLELRER